MSVKEYITMLIEKKIEDTLVEQFQLIPNFDNVQFITTRQETVHVQDNTDTVVAILVNWRQHDAFSLSPISIPVVLSIVSRVENDPNSIKHTHVCEELMTKLSYWHKFPSSITVLSNDKFNAGELRLDGGQSLGYDQNTKSWRDTISFTIRGAEIF